MFFYFTEYIGTIQILRNESSGWVGLAKCLCVLTWWVGLVKCLRNQKSNPEKWISLKWWKFDQSVSKNKYNLLFLFFFFFKDKTGHILKFMYLPSKQQKKLRGWVGFQKSYVIIRVGHGKCLLLLTRWMGGVKKGLKHAYAIFEWSLR